MRRTQTLVVVTLLLAAGRPVLADPELRSPGVDYVRDVQPVLSAHCYECHGAEKQKSGYRLDVRELAFAGGESGEQAIVPGDSTASPLIRFVAGLEPDMLMPPQKSDQPRLTPEEIGVLRAWIDAGASWPASASVTIRDPSDWWAFKPIALSPPPLSDERNAGWSRHPIDQFIAAKHREKGLGHSPEADRRTLLRRLYFDLTGLPPEPDAVERFTANPDSLAYEKLVDELLASPRYGERWARHWLDVVHFGETHGYDKDKPRPHAWPYRDYVIRAFNEDKPFGRFVEEQIAGDALFPGTADGLEALGFIAAGPWDFIGHAELPESKIDGKIARHLDRDDMVSNAINTFSSLTVHCAQCHDHKFDPIKQEDYYRLQAVFSALDRTDRVYYDDRALTTQRDALEARRREFPARKEAIEAAVRKLAGQPLIDLEREIAAAAKDPRPPRSPQYGYHSAVGAEENGVKWVQVDLGRQTAIQRVVLAPCDDDFNNIGAGFGFPVRFRVEAGNDPAFAGDALCLSDQSGADYPNPRNVPQGFANHATARYVRVTATRLAPRQNDFIFALAELEVFDEAGRNVATGAPVSAHDTIEAAPRWSTANLVDGVFPAAENAGSDRLAKLRTARDELLARATDPASAAALQTVAAQRDAVTRELAALPAPKTVYSGAVHHGEGSFTGTGAYGGRPRPIFVLARGDVTKPGKEVSAGALEAIPVDSGIFQLPPDAPEQSRRAALARWLTHRDNPLTWRSIVNRVWQGHFGRGLVETANDFGHMGELPTHPELLDWLAAAFRDGDQSIKQLHRLIVTSATYRQASLDNPDAASIDGDNTMLWRQNRRRLEAEAIRDSILAISGKLDLAMGGPSFQDFTIEKAENSPHYRYDLADPENPALHRRSVYRFIVRSQQQPWMAALDCADPSMLVPRRNETITPVQALAQLNNQLMLVMAKHFAARVDVEGEDAVAKITRAFHLALGRVPDPEELASLAAYVSRHGLANGCRAIMNLNEFVFVD